MIELTKKQKFAYWFLILSSFFLYIILTGAKNLYVAEQTTMERFFSRQSLADTMMYYFYAYAIMQVILVFFMKKINLKWYLTITLGFSAIITAIMAFTNTIIEQWILWTVNGIVQAGLWGCTVKILSNHLPAHLLPTSNKFMTSGPAVAGVISYGTAVLFGENWRLPFVILGIILLISVVLFFFAVSNVKKYPAPRLTHHVVHSDGTEEDVLDEERNDFIHLKNKKRVIVFYVVSAILGFLATGLYYTISNVLSYFVSDIGGQTNDVSKLITILAPIASIIGPIITVNACEKHVNFLKVSMIAYILSFTVSVLIALFFNTHLMISLPLVLIFLIITNGARSISLSIAAVRMRTKVDSGIYSTIVNVMASVATGVIPVIMTALIGDATVQGWSNAFTFTAIMNLILLFIVGGLVLWIKRLNKKDEEDNPQ